MREGSRAIVTAVKILEEREQEAKRGGSSAPGAGGPDGHQYSG